MTNRLKPLLATYHANQRSIDKIASQRIETSGEYERMCRQLGGPEFVRQRRTAEMRIVPDQSTAWLIGHHILCAQEILLRAVTLLNEPLMGKAQYELYTPSHRCTVIRKLTEA